MVYDIVRDDREIFPVAALVYDFEWVVAHKKLVMSVDPHLGELQLVEKILRFYRKLTLPVFADQFIELTTSSESEEDLARIGAVTDFKRVWHKQQKNRDQCQVGGFIKLIVHMLAFSSSLTFLSHISIIAIRAGVLEYSAGKVGKQKSGYFSHST